MKKTTVFLTLCLITLIVKAQDNKFSLGLNGSLNYYAIDFNPPQGFNHQYETTTSYNYGLTIQYNLNKKFFFQSGVFYDKKGYQLIYDFGFIAIDPVYLDPSIPQENELKLSFINIPLMVGYYLKKEGKLRFSVTTGFNNEILVQSTETLIFGGGVEKETTSLSQSYPSFLSSVQLNLGMEYHLGKKLFFSINSYFRYGFNTIDDAFMNFKSVSYGGMLSVNYKLFKQKKAE